MSRPYFSTLWIASLAVFLMSCRPAQDKRDTHEHALTSAALNDSTNAIDALTQAITLANEHTHEHRYVDTFETNLAGLQPIRSTVAFTNDFLKEVEHVIIHRETPGIVYVDVYRKSNGVLTHVLSHEQWGLTYDSMLIQDVNDDGHGDLLINWYGASGCCLKNFFDVYLAREDGSFSEQFEFINPTFSAREKIIRGVGYGHPGETELYKYAWTNSGVDTLEYIYPDPDVKGKYWRSRYLPLDGRNKNPMALQRVPDEYKNIDGFDWFMGNL